MQQKKIIHTEKSLKQGAKLLRDGIILPWPEEDSYPTLLTKVMPSM